MYAYFDVKLFYPPKPMRPIKSESRIWSQGIHVSNSAFDSQEQSRWRRIVTGELSCSHQLPPVCFSQGHSDSSYERDVIRHHLNSFKGALLLSGSIITYHTIHYQTYAYLSKCHALSSLFKNLILCSTWALLVNGLLHKLFHFPSMCSSLLILWFTR